MSSVGKALKREGVVQAWTLWILNATGERPNVTRHEDSVEIDWKPGQAAKMERYLHEAMQPKPQSPDDLNVNVNMIPVLVPLAVKKSVGYVVLYTVLIALATKIFWK